MKREIGEERYRGENEAVQARAIAAKGGDREARNDLFLEHRAFIERLSRRAKRVAVGVPGGTSSIEPEDVEQQAFIEFCALLDDWEPGQAPFLPYLARLLPWRLLHYVRRVLRYRSGVRMVPLSLHSGDDEDGPGEQPDIEDESAQRRILGIESSEAWKYHTDVLEDGLRQAVMLRYGLDMSSREIALIQGCSRRTVDRELRTALHRIKRSLEDGFDACG